VTRDEELRQAEAHDHARAGERGERLATITTAIVGALANNGLLRMTEHQARLVVFHTLADHLYGTAAIDIPEFDRP
jgi:hypothetical protein